MLLSLLVCIWYASLLLVCFSVYVLYWYASLSICSSVIIDMSPSLFCIDMPLCLCSVYWYASLSMFYIDMLVCLCSILICLSECSVLICLSAYVLYLYASLPMFCIDMLLCAIPTCSVRTPVRYRSVQCKHQCTCAGVLTDAVQYQYVKCEHQCTCAGAITGAVRYNVFSVNSCAIPMCSVWTPMHLCWGDHWCSAIPMCSVRTPVRYQCVQCEHLCDTNVFSANINAPVWGQHWCSAIPMSSVRTPVWYQCVQCEHQCTCFGATLVQCDTNKFSANTCVIPMCSVRTPVRYQLFSANTTPLCTMICSVRALLVL